MKYVWILTKEIEYQWTTYHFIHGVYESEELADKALSERVKQYGGDEDDYEIIRMPLIQEEVCARYIESLEAENAKLEKLNSAALERLSYHACPSVPSRNNYGQPCNDSDDCVACWREYLGGKDE